MCAEQTPALATIDPVAAVEEQHRIEMAKLKQKIDELQARLDKVHESNLFAIGDASANVAREIDLHRGIRFAPPEVIGQIHRECKLMIQALGDGQHCRSRMGRLKDLLHVLCKWVPLHNAMIDDQGRQALDELANAHKEAGDL
jgi:hypothetical protein